MEISTLIRSAVELEESWRKREYQFCFIGGIALQRWGEPRNTRDLDLTLLTGFGSELKYVDPILADLESRIDNARQFAILNRVLLVRDRHGVDIDISLGAMPFEERTIARASKFDVGPELHITTCSATDLIVHKAFAGRDQDWIDIRNILVRSRSHIDWKIVLEELTPLVELKEEPDILDRLNEIEQSTR